MQQAKPQNKGFDPARLTRLSQWMQRYVDDRKYPGTSLLIARDGTEVFFDALGQRDIEAGLPFERDTVVRLYSMTKPITSLAAMMLIEQGRFHLDAPVSDFIPGFKTCQALIPGAERIDQTEPASVPRIHHLMTHTSGLSYAFNPGLLPQAMEEADLTFEPEQGPLSKVVDELSALPLAFQPGNRWEYSVATDVLGRVVEVVSGQTLGAFFQQEIFEPLGMSETGFRPPAGIGNRFAALYTPLAGDPMALNAAATGDQPLRRVDGPGRSPFERTELHSGGGGLVGTIDDYMRFAEMLRQGGALNGTRLLSPGTVSFMTRNHLKGDIASMGPQSFAEQVMEGTGFGLGGAVILDPAQARSPGHVGDFSWGGMASTFFWIDRVADMSVVFLTQLSPSSSYPSRVQLKALVHGAMMS